MHTPSHCVAASARSEAGDSQEEEPSQTPSEATAMDVHEKSVDGHNGIGLRHGDIPGNEGTFFIILSYRT